jgi:hypothetical protein
MAKMKSAVAAKKASGGDPVKGTLNAHRTPLDDTADLRDMINYLVGSGMVDFGKDEAARGHLSRMSGTLGQDATNKLALQAFLFNKQNNRPMSPEQRLSSFYASSSADPGTRALIERAKAFGSGPIAGLYSTPDVGVASVAGRDVTASNNMTK